jgi:hypothetical protein
MIAIISEMTEKSNTEAPNGNEGIRHPMLIDSHCQLPTQRVSHHVTSAGTLLFVKKAARHRCTGRL